MSLHSLCLSDGHAELFPSRECECGDPPPPYPGWTDFEDVQEQFQHFPHPTAQSLDALFSSAATPDEPPVSDLSGLQIVGMTLVLNTPTYVFNSLATNAWGTRAIECAIGTGCVVTIAYLMLLVKKHRKFAGAVPGGRGASGGLGWSDAEVEGRSLAVFTFVLSPGIAGMGYYIRGLMSEGSAPEDVVVLVIAFCGVVPAVWVMVAVRWIGRMTGLIVSRSEEA